MRTHTLRHRSLPIAVVVACLAALAPLAHSAPRSTQPTGCDNSRPGVVHQGGGKVVSKAGKLVPCLTVAGKGYGEGTLTVTGKGTVLFGCPYLPGYSYPPTCSGVGRSTDKGGHWGFVMTPDHPDAFPGRAPGDPKMWRDTTTDRIFYSTDGVCTGDVSYSDDDGVTWKAVRYPAGGAPTNVAEPATIPYTTVDGTPMWISSVCAPFDFQSVFTGKPRTSKTKGYPNLVYWCASTHVQPDRQCYKSTDGGDTFREIGGSPQADQAGVHGATIADPSGVLFGLGGLGGGGFTVSLDEGETWTTRPLPAGLGSTGVSGNPGTNPAVDSKGTVYVVGISGGIPRVTYTKDRGQHWSTPVEVSMPGVKHVDQAAIAVGKPGHVAISYVGNGDASDTPGVPPWHSGGVHHGYLTVTDNLFVKSPLFTSVQVDSDKDPMLPYGYPALVGSSVSGPLTPARADYIGVMFSDTGQPWAQFYKDACPVTACANEGNLGRAVDKVGSNWMAAIATVTRRR